MDLELTDPAIELSELLSVLLGIESSPKPTWMMISKSLKLDPNTEDYSDFCTAVLARVSGLRSIAQEVTGSQRVLQRASKVISTADRLSHIFLPSGQAAGWSDSFSRLSITDGVNLANFSPEARTARPLRLVAPEERDEFLNQVNDAIEEISSCAGNDPWAKAALLREAKRLRTTLTHIDFFGHEFAAERTAVLAARTVEAQRSPRIASWNLPKTRHLLLGLAAAFIVPHDLKEATDTYLGWAGDIMQLFSGRLPQPDPNGSGGSMKLPDLPAGYPALPDIQKT